MLGAETLAFERGLGPMEPGITGGVPGGEHQQQARGPAPDEIDDSEGSMRFAASAVVHAWACLRRLKFHCMRGRGGEQKTGNTVGRGQSKRPDPLMSSPAACTTGTGHRYSICCADEPISLSIISTISSNLDSAW